MDLLTSTRARARARNVPYYPRPPRGGAAVGIIDVMTGRAKQAASISERHPKTGKCDPSAFPAWG